VLDGVGKKQPKYIDALLGYAKSIKDPQLNKLSAALWSYTEPFLWITPAAKGNHEPYRGGLAKHTYDVLKLIDNPVLWQMGLDWDVLVFSALYHDLGKVKCYTDTMSYITEGRLIPHSAMALELMSYAIASEGLFDINPKLLQHIRHCIMSHHGQWAEIVPMTREATVLHQMDMVASRLGHFEVVIKSGNVANDGWGPWDRVFEGAPYIPEMDVL
jgi:3'-5' exoribonuclease